MGDLVGLAIGSVYSKEEGEVTIPTHTKAARLLNLSYLVVMSRSDVKNLAT
jgi:hypothetical protein